MRRLVLGASDCLPTEESLAFYKWVFYLAQFLIGVGATPLYTLAVTYVDENVASKSSSVYLGGKELKLTRKRETHQSNVHLTKWLENTKASNSKKAQGSSVTKIHVRELTMALVRVVAGNPTFLFLTLAGAAEGFLLAGFATFLPKYFENQFRLTAGLAAMIVGVVAVPGAGGGTLLGGYLIKHYDMKLPAIMKMCCVSTFLAGLSTLIFVFSCDDVGIAGVTAAYEPSRLLFAGGNASADLGPRNSADDDDVDDESAFDRVVEEADRSIALGVQLALLRVLGTIPAPVLFGKLMDLACSLWETIPEGPGEGCDVQGDVGSAGVTISSSNSKGGAQLGSCRAYFNHSMSTYLLIVGVIGKVLEFLCFFLALKLYRAPPEPMAQDASASDDNDVKHSNNFKSLQPSLEMNGYRKTEDRGQVKPNQVTHAYDNPVPVDC
ncbi:unnamed protein product [Notodromas monacha]|uniref:Uncharacterized protein n=1 Tax=Notodromas monacha TaxID=399045 RepID=A0A7R9GHQ0_9CRUS|nr:unnamed protein product [Notodromas monacha]CAG0921585.1 unnamed protein product [Notodromas monacha]